MCFSYQLNDERLEGSQLVFLICVFPVLSRVFAVPGDAINVCWRKATMEFLWALLITLQPSLAEGDLGFYNLRVVRIDTYSHFAHLLMFWPRRSKSRWVLNVKHWRVLWEMLVNRWSGENRELCGEWVHHPRSISLNNHIR